MVMAMAHHGHDELEKPENESPTGEFKQRAGRGEAGEQTN